MNSTKVPLLCGPSVFIMRMNVHSHSLAQMTDQSNMHSRVLCTLLAATVWLGGCSHDAARSPPPSAEVGVVELQPKQVALQSELPGRTVAFLVSDVRPQVSGIVKKRLFEEGAGVTAGQVLYQIDPSSYQAAYDQAKADLGTARAQENDQPLESGRLYGILADTLTEANFPSHAAAQHRRQAQFLQGGGDSAGAFTVMFGLARADFTAGATGMLGPVQHSLEALRPDLDELQAAKLDLLTAQSWYEQGSQLAVAVRPWRLRWPQLTRMPRSSPASSWSRRWSTGGSTSIRRTHWSPRTAIPQISSPACVRAPTACPAMMWSSGPAWPALGARGRETSPSRRLAQIFNSDWSVTP